ncbi:hypothetical protein CEP54_003158 [Fusarium duplospermum]|uniref:Clr5 domain-containing protein n=1 Tax=Fusarium duplospermum TaxID=1325734 RepID=A0A428QR82_9HYPO|nr:hypothetical protein CEP54_003158 [Fusarium duplospermum]
MADEGSSNPTWVVDPTLDKHKRSIRITEEHWEKYKSILCTLYKSYTLNVVMEFMRKQFRFHASKRQYGYRLDKWGVKKYNSGEKKNSMGALEQMEFNRPFNTSLRLSLPSNITSTSAIADEMDHDGSIQPTKPSPRHRIRYPWGPGDGEAIKKLAADFCAAMSDDENAFRLYSSLYNFLSKSNQPHSATQMFVAISRARVADTPENARQAHGLLSSLLTQRQAYDDEPHFVMLMLKAYLEDREQTDNTTTVKHLTCATIDKFLEANGSLRHLPHNYSSIDLVAYYLLFYGLDQYEHALSEKGISPNFSTEHFLNDFIRRQPFVDMVRQNPASQPLRLCMAWCSDQLQYNHPVALQDSSAQSNLEMRHWWDNIRIFCTLWGVLLGLVRAGCAPEWYSQCESAYGISASELLVTVSWMIGAETTPHDYAVSDEDLLKNAAERAQSLWGLKESELLLKFLDKFEWMNELVDLVEDEKSFETFVQSQLRQYLSETLRITLPCPARSQESAALELDRFDTFEFTNDFGFVSVNEMPSPSVFFGSGSGR